MERQTATKAQKSPLRVSHAQRQSAGPSAPVHPILDLQRFVGNQAVQRLIRSPYIQAKLQVSTPGDPFEQEADRVADTVTRMPDAPVNPSAPVSNRTQISPIHRKCSECESKMQRSPIAGSGCSTCNKKQGATQESTPSSTSSRLVAALSMGGEEVEGEDEDVLTAQTPSGPIAPAPPPGSPAANCNYVITYENERTSSCTGGLCGAMIVFDITKVTATGAGCPRTLNGLTLTEVVTNDHGCSPANVQGGAGCPIEEHPPMAPGHAVIPPPCTDTYGVCLGATSQARIPPAGCTETVTQQLFVGGVLAETHLIRFPMRKTASGCTGSVNRT